MATPYSYAQLEGIAKAGGFPDSMLALMAAIAMAESGGNAAATNSNDNGGTQTSWGLWQISDGTHNQPAPNILDPVTNAKVAWAKYNTQGLGAWGTFTSGAYKSYMQGQIPPNLQLGPPAGGGNGGGGGAGTGSISPVSWFDPSTWLLPIEGVFADILNYTVWLAISAGGLILVGAGAFLMFHEANQSTGNAAGRYGAAVKHIASLPVRYAKG